MITFAGPLTPLRHRQFRLLWTGMSASLIGDGMLLVALAWQVYDLFGVPAAMSAVGVALSLPQVVTLLDTPHDERWIGFSTADDLVDRALTEELIGSEVTVAGFEIDRSVSR